MRRKDKINYIKFSFSFPLCYHSYPTYLSTASISFISCLSLSLVFLKFNTSLGMFVGILVLFFYFLFLFALWQDIQQEYQEDDKKKRSNLLRRLNRRRRKKEHKIQREENKKVEYVYSIWRDHRHMLPPSIHAYVYVCCMLLLYDYVVCDQNVKISINYFLKKLCKFGFV